jgi:hypothetical protein
MSGLDARSTLLMSAASADAHASARSRKAKCTGTIIREGLIKAGIDTMTTTDVKGFGTSGEFTAVPNT